MIVITRTQLCEEEDGHDKGRHESDDAAREGPAVEVLIDLGIRVQQLQLIQHVHGVHCRSEGRTDGERNGRTSDSGDRTLLMLQLGCEMRGVQKSGTTIE